MNRQVEWVKQGFDICAHDSDFSEEEKVNLFHELEAQYSRFTEMECKSIRDIINTSLDERDRIYIYSYFMFYMKQEDFEEEALEAILQMDFDFCIGSMLEIQITRMVSRCYAQKRRLHKKNMDGFMKVLNLDHPYIPVEKRNRKRVVIMTEQILSVLHAPTKLVLNTAYVLQERLGYEVMIFACPCDGGVPEELWYRPTRMNSMDLFRNGAMRLAYRDTIFKGYQMNLHPFNLKEYQLMFDLIHAWNPLFVFGMAIVNPIIELCTTFTTLVMRAGSTGCPVSEAEILIRLARQSEEQEADYLKVINEKQRQLFIEEKAPVVVEKSQNQYCRSEVGLPEEKFLIAIVGNRLDDEIDMEFVLLMQKIIQKAPNVAFVIIGEVEKIKKDFESDIFENHIFYLGYCADLVGIYGILDLYMNPKRMGGGYSSVMALAAGVPVVSLPKCDVAGHVGTQFIVKDYCEMEETVYRYVNEPEFYKEKQHCTQVTMEENSEEKMVQYVQNMMNDITELIMEKR